MTLLVTVGNGLVFHSYVRLEMCPHFDLVVTKKERREFKNAVI